MQSQINRDEADNIRIWIAIVGCLLMVAFLFSPLPERPHSSAGATIYMVIGNGLQWLIVLLSLLTLFLICFKQYLLAPFVAIGLLLTTLPITWDFGKRVLAGKQSTVRYIHSPLPPVAEPGILQMVLMLAGLALLVGAAAWAMWCEWNDEKYQIRAEGMNSPRQLSSHQQSNQEFFKMISIRVEWSVLVIGILSFLLWPLGLVLFFAFSKTDDEKANAAIIGACVALALMVARFIFLMATAANAP